MNVPAEADAVFSLGDDFLMYRQKPIGKWIVHYMVREVHGKSLNLDIGDWQIRASVDKVKNLKQKAIIPLSVTWRQPSLLRTIHAWL